MKACMIQQHTRNVKHFPARIPWACAVAARLSLPVVLLAEVALSEALIRIFYDDHLLNAALYQTTRRNASGLLLGVRDAENLHVQVAERAGVYFFMKQTLNFAKNIPSAEWIMSSVNWNISIGVSSTRKHPHEIISKAPNYKNVSRHVRNTCYTSWT